MFKLVYIVDGTTKVYESIHKAQCDVFLNDLKRENPNVKWKLKNRGGVVLDEG